MIYLFVSPKDNISTNNCTRHYLFLVFFLMNTPFFTACWKTLRISFFWHADTTCLYAINCAILSCGIRKPPRWPFPNILSTPRLAKPDKAPVTSGATAFLARGMAIGINLLLKLIHDPNKLPPCLTAFLICVFDIFISDPLPWLIAFFNLLIWVFVSINSCGPDNSFLASLIVIAELLM